MTTLDLAILGGVALGLVVGLRAGLIKQIASIVGLLLAFVLAVQLMRPVGVLISRSLDVSPSISPLVGFVLVFMGVQIIVFAAVKATEAIVGALKLGAVNRLLGGAVGAFKAVLALSVAFLVLGYLGAPNEPVRNASALYGPVASVLPASWSYIEQRLPQLRSLSEQFRTRVDEQISRDKATED